MFLGCQIACDLAISRRCGKASGQFSRDLANPQVGAAGISAADVVVVHTAQKLATSVETNSGGACLRTTGQRAGQQHEQWPDQRRPDIGQPVDRGDLADMSDTAGCGRLPSRSWPAAI